MVGFVAVSFIFLESDRMGNPIHIGLFICVTIRHFAE